MKTKTRAEVQSGYWKGGEIGGHHFNQLNLERQALLQAVWASIESAEKQVTTGAQTLVAMAIYNMCDLDVENAEPDFDKLRAWATERGLGRMSIPESEEFQQAFQNDVTALLASATKFAGDGS